MANLYTVNDIDLITRHSTVLPYEEDFRGEKRVLLWLNCLNMSKMYLIEHTL